MRLAFTLASSSLISLIVAVRVSSCDGKELATATTDAQGIASFSGLPIQIDALLPRQALDLFAELVEVLKAAVDRGKADIGHFIELGQLGQVDLVEQLARAHFGQGRYP